MLTAMAVLSLLLLLFFGMVESVSYVADTSQRRGDIDTEARQVLDRIGLDIAGMLIRSDVDQFYYVQPSGGSDKMFFYSQVAGYFPAGVVASANNPVTLVGYRINTTDNPNGQPVLERLAQGLMWDGAGSAMQFLTFQPPTSVTGPPTLLGGAITNQWSGVVGDTGDATPNPSYYDAIGSQVFRLGICFQLQNGTFSRNPGFTNSAPVSPGSITNTVAIVVAVAALDSKSRQLVPMGSWANLMSTAFPIDATKLADNPPVLMDSQWNAALTNSAFAQTAGIPALAASHIKVYQRYYYLNVPKAR
jgi:hypothetical protein